MTQLIQNTIDTIYTIDTINAIDTIDKKECKGYNWSGQKDGNNIDCIYITFAHCVFSVESWNHKFMRIQSHNDCIY